MERFVDNEGEWNRMENMIKINLNRMRFGDFS